MIVNNPIVCYGLKSYLEGKKDRITVDICKNINELKELLFMKKYDICVISIHLEAFNTSQQGYIHLGFNVARYIKETGYRSRVVMTCYYNRPIYEVYVNDLSIEGLISENISPEEFYCTLKYIMQGNYCINKVIINEQGHYRTEKINKMLFEPLSNKEIEVLSEIAQGRNIKQISEKLFISERTVSNHLNHVYSKLFAKNRQEAVYKALQLGYFLKMKVI